MCGHSCAGLKITNPDEPNFLHLSSTSVIDTMINRSYNHFVRLGEEVDLSWKLPDSQGDNLPRMAGRIELAEIGGQKQHDRGRKVVKAWSPAFGSMEPCEPTMLHISKGLIRIAGNFPAKLALKIRHLSNPIAAEGDSFFYEQSWNLTENKVTEKSQLCISHDVIENKADIYFKPTMLMKIKGVRSN